MSTIRLSLYYFARVTPRNIIRALLVGRLMLNMNRIVQILIQAWKLAQLFYKAYGYDLSVKTCRNPRWRHLSKIAAKLTPKNIAILYNKFQKRVPWKWLEIETHCPWDKYIQWPEVPCGSEKTHLMYTLWYHNVAAIFVFRFFFIFLVGKCL